MNESLHALSGAYVVDAVDEHEREAFEQHLVDCADCQAEVDSLREAAALMADHAATEPPADLRAAVLAGVATIRPLPPEVVRPSAPAPPSRSAEVVQLRPRRAAFTRMLVAAAAVAAVATGAVWQPWHDNTSSSNLTAADRVLTAADARSVSIGFEDGSSAQVVRSVKLHRAVLVTRGMASPPRGKAFELWLRDASGAMSPAGLMTTGGDHKFLLQGDAGRATQVGITVEPAGGSSQPTTKPIAMLDLTRGSA